MTVHELISILEQMDQDAIVKIPYSTHPDYGTTLFKSDFAVRQESVDQYRQDSTWYEVFFE